MTATVTSPRIRTDCDPALTEYWLRHCHGFQVLGPESRLGFVEAVETADDEVELVIAAGMFRPRTLVAHESDVAELNVARRRVVIRQWERWDDARPRSWSHIGSIGIDE